MTLSTAPGRALLTLAGLLIVAAGLTGCTATVSLERAEDGINPTCADVIVRLPETMGELAVRQTNAQGTGAWGTPATVTLRCGVEVPGPTTDLCIDASGIDWVTDDTQAPIYKFTTYGRDPAIEVIVNQDESADAAIVTGRTALDAVADAIGRIPQTNECSTTAD
jgi:hypothetical protein